MKPFYSILYVPIRPEVKERLTIGLFMRSDKEIFFYYSKQKLEVLNDLLPKQAYNLLKLSLHSIERTVIKAKKDYEVTLNSLMPSETMEYSVVGEPYFQYLSKYNQNLIAFTSPQYTNIEINFKNFKILFEKLISEGEFIQKAEEEKIDLVMHTRELLKPRIEKYVNWDFKVTNKHISKLILPSILVDFIGKNGNYVIGKTIDFDKPEHSLDNTIAKHIALIGAIHEERKNSKSFIIGKEPVKKFKEQHRLWQNIRNSRIMDFIDADEYETVADYVEQNNIQPLELIAD